MDPVILAVDFDGTLCDDAYPEIGKPKYKLIDYLKEQKAKGRAKLILWTCRVGDRLDEAVEFCSQRGLYFDAVNENLPESIDRFGVNTRKIFAHAYVDDRHVVSKKVELLFSWMDYV